MLIAKFSNLSNWKDEAWTSLNSCCPRTWPLSEIHRTSHLQAAFSASCARNCAGFQNGSALSKLCSSSSPRGQWSLSSGLVCGYQPVRYPRQTCQSAFCRGIFTWPGESKESVLERDIMLRTLQKLNDSFRSHPLKKRSIINELYPSFLEIFWPFCLSSFHVCFFLTPKLCWKRKTNQETYMSRKQASNKQRNMKRKGPTRMFSNVSTLSAN